ncbi:MULTISPECIES: IclR family transcriptional regulator [Bradyrhizobium]|uniref:IclR family transcriptional regulator n=1 Tax=Bradyrhizobium TaxID=374 RepID=UPI000419CF0A|nr:MULTISPECIES: IclR family transcriptional regulator [Bradyrhizobium]QOG20690.1 helix-turn-helix domain-containing protein [Bradyrhizobium sp. SEMIA]UFW46112.1 IclR family transcriptional regulator [Bradyrhizobium arachidis]
MARASSSKRRLPHATAAAVLAASTDDAAFATTLAKGLVVLEAFKAGTTLLGNMELSKLTGIPRPTVARLTHTLAELGYLRYEAARTKYRLAARALRMAHPLLADMQFRQLARPMMQELAQSVRGTVSIGLLDATSMIYVETARSGDVGPHVPDVGMPIPVVMTAMGRAAAATLPLADAERLERQIAAEDAELWAAFRDKYRAGLAQCASRGFCTCFGEYIASIHAVAAPLFHARELNQSFSINCGIPAFRLQPGQLEGEIGPRIAALADSIRAVVHAAEPAVEMRKSNKKSANR